MSTNIAGLAWKSAGGTAARTNAARWGDVLSVKEFGATGDGVTDDRPAIQAAIDYCFPLASLVDDNSYAKVALYFPPGNYRCHTSTTGDLGQGILVINWGRVNRLNNVCMFGDNSATTRIFYDGAVGSVGNTLLLNIDNRVDCSLFRGLHFDMSQTIGGVPPIPSTPANYTMCIWNRGRQGNAGRANVFYDIKCTGASFGFGDSGESASLGSENLFLFCKFNNCVQGLTTFSANALGITVIGGQAKDNSFCGIAAQQGAVGVMLGVEFAGNAPQFGGGSGQGDFSNQNSNGAFMCGCVSTSQDFLCFTNGPIKLVGNYHNGSAPGYFLFLKSAGVVMDGNYSVSGIIANPDSVSGVPVYLRGNRFGNASYISAFLPYPALIPEPSPWNANYAAASP